MKIGCVLLCAVHILAAPRLGGQKDLPPEVLVDESNRPSFSLYDHIMGNLKSSNKFVHLVNLPQGIPPPLEDDYDEAPPVPIYNYAFFNPAVNGGKMPHWTDTLENFKNNPAISPEVKVKVVQKLQTPIKIYGDGTESRFPLLVEYFVQRIQKYFSHYVYEDMSRPSSWDVKPNDTDNKPVSSEKEPVSSEKEPITEDPKVDLSSDSEGQFTASNDTDTDDIDYIVDITLRPDLDDEVNVLTDVEFEKTTEEWEDTSMGNETEAKPEKVETVVVVEKEVVDLKVLPPIGLEDDAFIYVGDGTGDELMRNNIPNKLRKKKLN